VPPKRTKAKRATGSGKSGALIRTSYHCCLNTVPLPANHAFPSYIPCPSLYSLGPTTATYFNTHSRIPLDFVSLYKFYVPLSYYYNPLVARNPDLLYPKLSLPWFPFLFLTSCLWVFFIGNSGFVLLLLDDTHTHSILRSKLLS
jgi:hypothetical protein